MTEKPIKRLKTEIIYKDTFRTFHKDEVIFNNNKIGTYTRLENTPDGDGVVIIPMDKDQNFYLIETYRYPLEDWSIEFPRGFGMRGKSSKEAAKIELKEELGAISNNITFLGKSYNDTGLTKDKVKFFLAENIMMGKNDLEETEFIRNVYTYSMDEIKKAIKDGMIKDSFTIAALAYLTIYS